LFGERERRQIPKRERERDTNSKREEEEEEEEGNQEQGEEEQGEQEFGFLQGFFCCWLRVCFCIGEKES
jgi:hypothetical protein